MPGCRSMPRFPATQTRWHARSAQALKFVYLDFFCPGPWRLPTPARAFAAMGRTAMITKSRRLRRGIASSQRIFILSAGGHGRVCAEVAEAMGYQVAGFLDMPRTPGELVNGKPIPYRTLRELVQSEDGGACAVFIAASENALRCRLIEEARLLGFPVPTIVHPTAVISPTCQIGEGTVVMPGVVVNANTRIGRGCILNTACSIDHDSVLDEGVASLSWRPCRFHRPLRGAGFHWYGREHKAVRQDRSARRGRGRHRGHPGRAGGRHRGWQSRSHR